MDSVFYALNSAALSVTIGYILNIELAFFTFNKKDAKSYLNNYL